MYKRTHTHHNKADHIIMQKTITFVITRSIKYTIVGGIWTMRLNYLIIARL